jgi:enoyl-[acyl-carrier protein] reductase/trans-2-enoyl-CoA reductase (NAD+)
MQLVRLYRDFLFTGQAPAADALGRLRLDDWEMRDDVQTEVAKLWQQVTAENLGQLADIEGFRSEFLQHHGFEMPGVDYTRDVDPAGP